MCNTILHRIFKRHQEPKKTLVGKKFGRLLVESYAYSVVSDTGASWVHIWNCKCDCGCLVSIRYNNLISGNTRSCGCLRGGFRYKRGVDGDGG